jgi:hypothetical protein
VTAVDDFATVYKDGYRPDLIRCGDKFVLCLIARAGGDIQEPGPVEIGRYRDTPGDSSGYAAANRAFFLTDALARFFNTGGSADELRRLVDRFLDNTDLIDGTLPMATLHDECKLMFTGEDAARVHVYRCTGGSYLKVVDEGDTGYTEEITETQLGELLAELL